MAFHDILSVILMLIGTLVMIFAGWGVVKMPDTYLRLSATSKSTTLGIISILLAAVAHFYTDFGVVNRALATILFILITVPISAHMLGRAAKIRGEELSEESVIDESRGHYDDVAQSSDTPPTRSETHDASQKPPQGIWRSDPHDSWNC